MPNPILGEIRLTGFNYPPRGWALCDGALLAIKNNPALYAIIGTTYGGDGENTFALPDLRGRAPMHVSAHSPDNNPRSYGVLGEQNGQETVTLDDDQTPQHTHAFSASSVGNGRNPQNAVLAAASSNNAYADPNSGTLQALNPKAILPSNGGQAHDNMQPFTTLNFIISLTGTFPQRGQGDIGLFREVTNGGYSIASAAKVNDSVLKRLFLINAGESPLQVDAPKLSNWVDAIAVPISGQKIVQPGEVSEIAFECQPTNIGGFFVDVTVSANRMNFYKKPPALEPPTIYHTFQVQGTLTDSAIAVTTAAGAPIYNKGKDWQGFEVPPDTPQKIGFIIKNTAKTGGGDLTVQPPEFLNQTKITSVSSSLTSNTTIAPGKTYTLVITYVASSAPNDKKPFSFDVSINNSSSSLSPFVFTVNGTASVSMADAADAPKDAPVAQPIAKTDKPAALRGSEPIPRLILFEYLTNGSTYKQLACLAGKARTIEITVMPPGAAGASVSNPTLGTTTNVSNVTLSPVGKQSLGPEERTAFSVTYQPVKPGDYSFAINMGTSSPLVPNYNIVISGEAVSDAPVMEVFTQDNAALLSGEMDQVANPCPVNQAFSRSYTIKNTGNVQLKLESVEPRNGANAIGTPLPGARTVPPGGSLTLVVSVTPTTTNPPNTVFTDFFSLDIVIQTNDASTSPYLFTIGGTETSS